jgi:hypothetical protein
MQSKIALNAFIVIALIVDRCASPERAHVEHRPAGSSR